jgi:hypothetical protein
MADIFVSYRKSDLDKVAPVVDLLDRATAFVCGLLVPLVVLVSLISAASSAAQEPERFALVIGNQSYRPSVGVLKNPHNDIALVAGALQKQGYIVLPPVRDARRSTILVAVRELVAKLNSARPGAIGFVYYSGHGAAEKDTNINYLIPVDAQEPGTATFWEESVKLDEVLRLLEGARNAAKFVVFDACRNELQLPERTSDKGLIPVREHQGMFIAYSTGPGRVASDRGAASGPYAAALAAELGKPGLDHLNLFQNVKETVLTNTNGVQQPWESNGLGRRVMLTPPPKEALSKPPDPAMPPLVVPPTPVVSQPMPSVPSAKLTVLQPQAPPSKPNPGDGKAVVPGLTPVPSSQRSDSDMLAPGLPRILERYRNLRPNDIEAKLAEDVFRLGLVWVPRRDSVHSQMLRQMFDRYIGETGSVGSCFARLMDGAKSRANLIDQLMKEMGRYSSSHLSFAKKGYDQVVVTFGTSALGGDADMGRKCVQLDFAAMPQKLEIQIALKEIDPSTDLAAASAQSNFVYFTDYRLSEVDAQLKMLSAAKGRKLRLPIGHEAFMIATAIAYRQTVIEEPEVNFWFQIDQQRFGYFQLKVDANRNIEFADYQIANPPASEKRTGALFFIVDGD